MLFGELSGGSRVMAVVGSDPARARCGLLHRRECDQPVASGRLRLIPVSWSSAGLPDARYRVVRSLNQPVCACTYAPFATENSAPEPCTYCRKR